MSCKTFLTAKVIFFQYSFPYTGLRRRKGPSPKQ